MDPREVRLSEHFTLSDFLGNHSVYSRGLKNLLAHDDRELPLKMGNARALCEELLEPLLKAHGPMSVSYGYITPDVSKEIVKYQDPKQASHHQWNLGAAADICMHRWVNGDPDDDTIDTAPVALTLQAPLRTLPYSRVITYSESPYVCVAASAREIQEGKPRLAHYENRYPGKRGLRPDYRKYASAQSKEAATAGLRSQGLGQHGWRGAGYPTYHGGGHQQYQHLRLSKYTMLIDWLFDLNLITIGRPNVPNRRIDPLMDLFEAAGDTYDHLIDTLEVPRLNIVQGYVAPSNQRQAIGTAWSETRGSFALAYPEYLDETRIDDVLWALSWTKPKIPVKAIRKNGRINVSLGYEQAR